MARRRGGPGARSRRSLAAKGTPGPSAAAETTGAGFRHAAALRAGTWICLGLILFTPYVITPGTTFPYIVGKAIYSRVLIEALFVLWAFLWLADSRYRPPRSVILLLLAAGLAVAALATLFGASPQRSLWSGYERMQGLVDQAHWFVFTLVLASLLRTTREWLILLNLSLAASVGIALLTTAQLWGLEDFVLGPLGKSPRISATLGNPLFLGAYSMAHLLIAAALLGRAILGGGPSNAWLEWCWWGGAAAIHLWTLSLTGARGALLALLAGLTVAAVLSLMMPARSRKMRQGIVAALVLGGVLVAGASVAVVLAGRDAERLGRAVDNPLVSRLLVSAEEGNYTIRTRVASWAAGWNGFLDRPILGWGPENFIVPFGLYVKGETGGDMEIHDNAHNRPLEELVTRGLLGLLAFLGAWLFAFAAIFRAARQADPGNRFLYLFASGALCGYLVQHLLMVPSITANLMTALLLAFAVHLEPGAREKETKAVLSARGLRAAVAAGAVALSAAGAGAQYGAWRGAAATLAALGAANKPNATPKQVQTAIERAINAFAPAANLPRMLLFDYAGAVWPQHRGSSETEADELLAFAEKEAGKALASEPENWRIRAAVAEMYRELAAADPAFKETAGLHASRAREMAPHRNPGQPAPRSRNFNPSLQH